MGSQLQADLIAWALSAVVSAGTGLFVSGIAWGRLSGKVDNVSRQQAETVTKSDFNALAARFARIEVLFELRPRRNDSRQQ